MKKTGIALGQPVQVFRCNTVFKSAAASLDPFNQRRGRRLQINHQVGRRRFGLEVLINFPIQVIFGIAQGQPGKKRVLIEQKIADSGFGEHIDLRQAL